MSKSDKDIIPATLNLDYYIKKYVAIIGAYLFIAIILAYKKKTFPQIYHLLTDKWFIIALLIMISYIMYAFAYTEDDHFRDSVMAGFTAFIIALCAKLDLIFIPFFIIFSLRYYVPSSN